MSAHLHILGICGTFMGGIAAIAKAAGYRVTGCDSNVYPPMSDQLRALGIELTEGFDESQLKLRPDAWVIGNVVTRGNPLMEAILDQGERYVSGPQWLAENVLAGKHVLAIAGTHGKTTASAMLAWVLERAGRAPGFLIGGVPMDFPVSARHTDSPLFVIEADEYDTAFFDKRSKFVHYRPKTAVLNNLEFDHADIFDDLAAIERQFHHLVRTVPRSGRLVVNGSDEALKRVLSQGAWSPVEWFASPGAWEAGPLDTDGGFEIVWQEKPVGRVRWQLLGAHNQLNALAVVAAARHVGVDPGTAIEALNAFSGVRRRMQVRGEARGITLYDDFAHHPTAIRTTVEGLRKRIGRSRILAVLEPRSNTMKRGVMKDELPSSLREADRIYVYSAGLGWDAAAIFAPLGARARCEESLDALVSAVAAEARPGDHVLVMSNGGFGGIHEKLLARLGEERVIVYLHGFNSSPQSHKAKLLGEYLAQRGLAACYGCPALPPLACEAVRVIEASLASGEVCFVGSSLGGFYATYLAEARGARAVLINPAIAPYVGLRAYLGPQRNLYSGQAYELTEAHLHDWEKLEVPRITPSRYLLLVETGDEVLDYRQAVRRYAGCEQVVVEGGDHSLQSFPRHLARIVEFAGHAALV